MYSPEIFSSVNLNERSSFNFLPGALMRRHFDMNVKTHFPVACSK